jgi:hypothetical protein
MLRSDENAHRDPEELGKFAFGDRTIPIHARTLYGPDENINPNAMGVYYSTVQSAVVHTN